MEKNKEKNKIKKELRILGVDDGPFNKFKDKDCLVVATVFRGGNYMDGLLSTRVEVDGTDSTKKLITMIKKSSNLEQLRCIMLDGIALAGFNVVNIQELSKKTKLPVIVIIRKKPNFKKIISALKKADKRTARKKLEFMKKAGKIYSVEIKRKGKEEKVKKAEKVKKSKLKEEFLKKINKKIYFQIAGINEKKASEIIKISATHALIPEPLRIAHIIAAGIVLGESHGKA